MGFLLIILLPSASEKVRASEWSWGYFLHHRVLLKMMMDWKWIQILLTFKERCPKPPLPVEQFTFCVKAPSNCVALLWNFWSQIVLSELKKNWMQLVLSIMPVFKFCFNSLEPSPGRIIMEWHHTSRCMYVTAIFSSTDFRSGRVTRIPIWRFASWLTHHSIDFSCKKDSEISESKRCSHQ